MTQNKELTVHEFILIITLLGASDVATPNIINIDGFASKSSCESFFKTWKKDLSFELINPDADKDIEQEKALSKSMLVDGQCIAKPLINRKFG